MTSHTKRSRERKTKQSWFLTTRRSREGIFSRTVTCPFPKPSCTRKYTTNRHQDENLNRLPSFKPSLSNEKLPQHPKLTSSCLRPTRDRLTSTPLTGRQSGRLCRLFCTEQFIHGWMYTGCLCGVLLWSVYLVVLMNWLLIWHGVLEVLSTDAYNGCLSLLYVYTIDLEAQFLSGYGPSVEPKGSRWHCAWGLFHNRRGWEIYCIFIYSTVTFFLE